jgi:hypothetical protein
MAEAQHEGMIAGYHELARFLNGEGFKTSHSTLAKYCSPAIGIGPPSEGYWGRLPIFKPSRVREWALARIRPAKSVDAAA